MKKLIALALSALLFLPLIGCRADEVETPVSPNNQTEEGADVDDTSKDAEEEKKEASDGVDDGKNNTDNQENTQGATNGDNGTTNN